MRKTLLLAASFLLSASTAQAQILGGGGAIGGGLGGTLGGTASSGTDTVRSGTANTSETTSRGNGTASADRRSGRVTAVGTGEASNTASGTQSVATPRHTGTASTATGTAARGSASADATLIGTDRLGSATRSAVGTARGTASTATSTGVAITSATVVSASSMPNRSLALSGSAASSVAGTFDLKQGTALYAASGKKIGKVREVRTDIYGYVTAMLVRVDGQETWLPAGNFSANGTMLVSAMSQSQIKRTGEAQEEQAKREPREPAPRDAEERR